MLGLSAFPFAFTFFVASVGASHAVFPVWSRVSVPIIVYSCGFWCVFLPFLSLLDEILHALMHLCSGGFPTPAIFLAIHCRFYFRWNL